MSAKGVAGKVLRPCALTETKEATAMRVERATRDILSSKWKVRNDMERGEMERWREGRVEVPDFKSWRCLNCHISALSGGG